MQDESLRSCLCCHEYNSNSRSGGQQGPQETAFPPLNTFYSSSEFSHSAADEILLFASENQNYNHYLLFFFFFTQRTSQTTWIRREVSMPRSPQGRWGRSSGPPAVRGGPLSVPAWVPSRRDNPPQGCGTPTPPCPPTPQSGGGGGGQPMPQPLLRGQKNPWFGNCTFSDQRGSFVKKWRPDLRWASTYYTAT